MGVGNISGMYLRCITRTPVLQLAAVAASTVERAQAAASQFGVRATSFADMVADPAIDLIVNLTPAGWHGNLNEAVLAAGKHLYSEKPFALSLASTMRLDALAMASGVQWSSAPDTFLGGGHQGARGALDAGRIGAPVFGTGFVGHGGPEGFHPDPRQFYQRGGEMPFDVGPYHIAQWINLLGPVRKVYCASRRGRSERRIEHGPHAGACFPVEVDTSFGITMDFDSAWVTLSLSLDVADARATPSVLYGTEGVMTLPDPNFFGGEPTIRRRRSADKQVEIAGLPFGAVNMRNYRGDMVANYRGVGLIDLALSIRTGRSRHLNRAFVTHMVEVMDAIMMSANCGHPIAMQSRCDRPAAMGHLDTDDELVALTPSPAVLADA